MATRIDNQTIENTPDSSALVPIAQPDGGGGYDGKSASLSDIATALDLETTAGSQAKADAAQAAAIAASDPAGTAAALVGDLSGVTDAHAARGNVGLPIAEIFGYGRREVRDFHAQLSKIISADGTSQAVIVLLGDSWIHNGTIYTTVRDYFQTIYGDAGKGFLSFGSPGETGISITTNGTWSTSTRQADSHGVDLTHVSSVDDSTPASKSFSATATDLVIHYIKQSGGGTFRYQVDAGGWTNVSTDAALAHDTVAISGLSDASHTLEIEVLSAGNGVILTGVDIQRTGNGVRVNALGTSGARLSEWQQVDATIWQDGLTALSPNLVMLFSGTNDQAEGVTPATFETYTNTMLSRINTAMPYADRVLFFPGDNNVAAPTYTMAQYDDVWQAVASASSIGYLSAYQFIGDYATANARGLYANDTHLETEGYRLLGNALCFYIDLRLSITHNLSANPAGAERLKADGTGGIAFEGMVSVNGATQLYPLTVNRSGNGVMAAWQIDNADVIYCGANETQVTWFTSGNRSFRMNPQNGVSLFVGTVQSDGYKSSDGSSGLTTTFVNGDGNTVTVKNGIITNIA